MNKPLIIVIPLYKNPHLAERLVRSFIELKNELKINNASILFVNDSPDDESLALALKAGAPFLIKENISFEILENSENLGFVKSTNRGLEECLKKDADALLLNSDAILSSGSLSELRRIANLDPMFGFVTPRSNNATICSLPFDTRNLKISFDEAYNNFKKLSPYLPEYQIAPTGVGFCMLIKNTILNEFGILDEVYSPGYNEENDMCMRANRCGYTVAIANRAFVFHDSSSSFGEDERSLHDKRNRETLLKRYPEYDRMVEDYFASPQFQFESVLEPIVGNDSITRVAIDLTHFKQAYNGTYEFGKKFIHSLFHSDLRTFQLNIICGEREAAFHSLDREFPSISFYPPDTNKKFDIIIKPAQPFEYEDLHQMARLARYNFCFMLDSIAIDCGYIRSSILPHVWELAARTLDGIFFISTFSKDQFNRRFLSAANTPQLATQLSVYFEDYIGATEPTSLKSQNIRGPFVFVIGNHYEHKFLKPTLERLSIEFPDVLFVALGGKDSTKKNIKIIKSGSLQQSEIDWLYSNSQAIVFPSHYEGFGFPIPHGLARDKIVIARHSPLNEEIKERWIGKGELYLFNDHRDMSLLLKDALNRGSSKDLEKYNTNKKYDWNAFSVSVIQFINKVISSDPSLERCKYRSLELSLCKTISDLKQQIENKEEERVKLADELHLRNLAYLNLLDSLKTDDDQETSPRGVG